MLKLARPSGSPDVPYEFYDLIGGYEMYSVIRMSGKLYAMKSANSFDDFIYDAEELERAETFVKQGEPIVFCEDLEDLESLFDKIEDIEIVEKE